LTQRRNVWLAATIAILGLAIVGTLFTLRGDHTPSPGRRITAGAGPELVDETSVPGAPELPADLATSLATTTSTGRRPSTTRASAATTVEAARSSGETTSTTTPPPAPPPTQPPCTAPVALLCAVTG
jgi:hypothetical protein